MERGLIGLRPMKRNQGEGVLGGVLEGEGRNLPNRLGEEGTVFKQQN